MSNSSEAKTSDLMESASKKSPEQDTLERYFEHAFAFYREDEYVTLGFSQVRVDQDFLKAIESLVPGGVDCMFREIFVKDIGIVAVQRGKIPAIAEVERSYPSLTNAVGEYVRRM